MIYACTNIKHYKYIESNILKYYELIDSIWRTMQIMRDVKFQSFNRRQIIKYVIH